MTRNIRVRAAAERDVEELYYWFENQTPGLGRRFVEELDAVYNMLEESPLIHAKIYRNTRRAMLKKFPVGVFYVETKTLVQIIAVNHLARNPSVWQRRS